LAVFRLGGDDIIVTSIRPDQIGTIFRIHVRRRGVDDGPGRIMIVFRLDLLAHAGGDDRPVQEVVVHHFLEESFADEIYDGGVLDGRRLAIQTFPSLIMGQIKMFGKIMPIHTGKILQRQVRRKDIMHRMEDGQTGLLGIGGDGAARHPVVAVNDELSLVLGPDGFDDVVDDLPLKFRGRQHGIPRIGAQAVGKDRRADQMDALGIQTVALLPPFPFIQIALPLKAALEVQGHQVDVNATFHHPLA